MLGDRNGYQTALKQPEPANRIGVAGFGGRCQVWLRVRRRLALRANRRWAAFALRRRAALGFS